MGHKITIVGKATILGPENTLVATQKGGTLMMAIFQNNPGAFLAKENNMMLFSQTVASTLNLN